MLGIIKEIIPNGSWNYFNETRKDTHYPEMISFMIRNFLTAFTKFTILVKIINYDTIL